MIQITGTSTKGKYTATACCVFGLVLSLCYFLFLYRLIFVFSPLSDY